MKIKLLSDLHSEFWQHDHPHLFDGSDCDVLVLAGDIASFTDLEAILRRFAANYKQVIYTPGNHEFYGVKFMRLTNLKDVKNLHIMHPGCVKIGDVTFIAATLWTNFRNDPLAEYAARSMINDFKVIKGFSPKIAREEFYRDFDFIKRMYGVHPGKKVIVTHFLPAVECVSKRFRNEGLLNHYFANDLGEWISHLTSTIWMFGHTHDSIDIEIGETRLVSNPYGYHGYELNKQFKNLIIEV